MELDKIGTVTATSLYTSMAQQVGTKTVQNTQGGTSDAGTQAVPQANDQVNLVSSAVTRRNLDMVKAIEQEHARLNQLAKDVKATNEQLDQAAGKVGQMNTAVTTIVKNNPPFPPDSEKRKELLMSYASIRKEIIQMTFPRPPEPSYEKVKGMWSSLFGPTGQIIHSAVPELHSTSSDSEVHAAATVLNSTGETVASLSSGITQALIKP